MFSKELGISGKRITELPEFAIIHKLFPSDEQMVEQKFLLTLMNLVRSYGHSSWDITSDSSASRVINNSVLYKKLKERQAIMEQLTYIVCNITKEELKNDKSCLYARYYFGTMKLAAILCNDAGSYEKAKSMIDNNFFSDSLPVWKVWSEKFVLNLKTDPFKMLTDLEMLDSLLEQRYGIKYYMNLARNVISGAKNAKESR